MSESPFKLLKISWLSSDDNDYGVPEHEFWSYLLMVYQEKRRRETERDADISMRGERIINICLLWLWHICSSDPLTRLLPSSSPPPPPFLTFYPSCLSFNSFHPQLFIFTSSSSSSLHIIFSSPPLESVTHKSFHMSETLERVTRGIKGTIRPEAEEN